MDDELTTDQTDHARHPPNDELPIRAVVEKYDDRPPECTLFPVDVIDRDERLRMWITAVGDAFISLRVAR